MIEIGYRTKQLKFWVSKTAYVICVLRCKTLHFFHFAALEFKQLMQSEVLIRSCLIWLSWQ
jgi:hypothetical protein